MARGVKSSDLIREVKEKSPRYIPKEYAVEEQSFRNYRICKCKFTDSNRRRNHIEQEVPLSDVCRQVLIEVALSVASVV